MLVALLALTLAAAPPKPVVSVLYFENRSKDAELEVLGKGMADMIITDLVAWDGVTVVERNRLDAVLKELQLQRSKAFDPGSAVKVGKLVGAQYAITGSLLLQGEQLRIDAAVTSIDKGETVASASATDTKDRVFELEQQLVEKLVTAIDTRLKGSSGRAKAKVPDFEALLAYSKAIDLSDQGKHDEAQKAMAALVSKSPTFAMAREQKQALLEKLKEYEERKKDLVSAAVLEIGKRADAELLKAHPAPLWRWLKGRYLLRVLKQSLSFRAGHQRVVKRGQEPQALAVLKAYVENQRALIAQLPRSSPDLDLGKLGLYELVRDSGLSTEHYVRLDPRHLRRELSELIIEGRADDGARFAIAPPLATLDPKELDRALGETADEVKRAEAAWRAAQGDRRLEENELLQALSQRGELLELLRRDDEAAQVYQQVLDLFPTHPQSKTAEERIQKIIGAVRDNTRSDRERTEKALRGECDDFYLDPELGYRLRRKGLTGADELTKEIEGICLGRFELRGEWDRYYSHLAHVLSQHDDCAGARAAHLKRYAWGGASNRSFASLSRYEPWCDYGLREDTLHDKLRVLAFPQGRTPHTLKNALVELLGDELRARGVPVAGENDSSNNESTRFDFTREGDALTLVTMVSREERTGNSVRSWFEPVLTTVSRDGRIDVEAALQPLLASIKRGGTPAPWKPSPTLSVKTLDDYAAALELYDKRKYEEAKAAFDALAAAEPELHGPRARSAMATELLAKKK